MFAVYYCCCQDPLLWLSLWDLQLQLISVMVLAPISILGNSFRSTFTDFHWALTAGL